MWYGFNMLDYGCKYVNKKFNTLFLQAKNKIVLYKMNSVVKVFKGSILEHFFRVIDLLQKHGKICPPPPYD